MRGAAPEAHHGEDGAGPERPEEEAVVAHLKTQSLRKEIAEKQEQTEKFNAELAQVQAERDKALKTNKGIRIEQSDSELPQVIDYIKLKAEVSELLKKRSDWERKIEIMELKKLSAAK